MSTDPNQPVGGRPDPEPTAPAAKPGTHRFKFGQKWEVRREKRSTKNAWKVILLDLALLLAIVALTWLLVKRLE